MANPEFPGLRPLAPSLNDMLRGIWIAIFLLAACGSSAFSAVARPVLSSGDQRQGHPMLFSASIATMPMVRQSQTSEEKGRVEENAPAASALGPMAVQSIIAGVRSPSLQALGQSLGLNPTQMGHKTFEESTVGMEPVSGLGNNGAPVVAVKWGPSGQGQTTSTQGRPNLYLLSWDGKIWQASYLTRGSDALTLEVLPVSGDAAPLVAVVIYRGVTAVPYPVIFRFQNHHAALVWDGRSDAASYTGYNYGSIQFEKAGTGNVPVLIATGRADPGLLMFPSLPEETGRGFQVATAYVWKNNGYVPLRTVYTQNRDYLIYRFISALHLHDFKTAYSLIDPRQFLKTKKPTLDLFRERIQNVWPEFIDDRIFEVPAHSEMEPEGHIFILKLPDGNMNVYHPAFTAGPEFRLTGLERTESPE